MNKGHIQAERAEAISKAMNTGTTERVIPDRILTEAPGGYAVLPVVRSVAYPPGTAPKDAPISASLTVVEVRTAHGVRWFGFQRAWLGSDLRMHVDGYPAGFEEVAKWPKP